MYIIHSWITHISLDILQSVISLLNRYNYWHELSIISLFVLVDNSIITTDKSIKSRRNSATYKLYRMWSITIYITNCYKFNQPIKIFFKKIFMFFSTDKNIICQSSYLCRMKWGKKNSTIYNKINMQSIPSHIYCIWFNNKNAIIMIIIAQ